MLYQRLELHIDEETWRRLQAHAALNNQTVEALCVDIIRQYLDSREAPGGQNEDDEGPNR